VGTVIAPLLDVVLDDLNLCTPVYQSLVALSLTNGGDHDVVLTDRSADRLQLEREAAVFERGSGVHQPEFPHVQRLAEPQDVPLPLRAAFGAKRKFSQHWYGDADPVASSDYSTRPRTEQPTRAG
jgi:hypothetical protein